MAHDVRATQDGAARSAPEALLGVVGIGASAGGLKALEALVGGLRPGPGLAYVVSQHMLPDAHSMLAEILQRFTTLPVRWIEDGLAPEPDTIYVNPPGRYVELSPAAFSLVEAALVRGVRKPIDHFFTALAPQWGARSVAVVLTGGDGDGALGVQLVKEHGGLVIAQDPETAEYPSMPCAAIDTGTVDAVLAPEAIAQFLTRYAEAGLSRTGPRGPRP